MGISAYLNSPDDSPYASALKAAEEGNHIRFLRTLPTIRDAEVTDYLITYARKLTTLPGRTGKLARDTLQTMGYM
ncbi:MAG: hypothetical protein HYW23_00590 [Candidatus Aenigmarchaeota archaeon]|nr:hypothetical protein [Candidatus Aenigmarchaeota archaeon]